MEIRQSLNKKPALAITIAIVLVAGSAFAIFRESHPPEAVVDTRVYFTDDDGKTWFKDEVNKIPPFDHDGKQAVRSFMYQHNGQTFVGYLQKDSDALKSKIQARNSASDSDLMNGTLVKRPGDQTWLPSSDPRAHQIMSNIKAPDGSTDVTSMDD